MSHRQRLLATVLAVVVTTSIVTAGISSAATQIELDPDSSTPISTSESSWDSAAECTASIIDYGIARAGTGEEITRDISAEPGEKFVGWVEVEADPTCVGDPEDISADVETAIYDGDRLVSATRVCERELEDDEWPSARPTVRCEGRFTVPSTSKLPDNEYTVGFWGTTYGFLDDHESVTISVENVDGRIIDFDPPRGDYSLGDEVRANVEVENTGSERHTFYVGYGVRDSRGDIYDNGGSTHESVTLSPGERRTVRVEWDSSEGSPDTYDAATALWKREDGGKLYGRLDERWAQNTFDLEKSRVNGRITDFDPPNGEYTEGDTVRANVVVENTGNVEHTFYVGYGLIGPDGREYDNEGSTHRSVTLDPGQRRSVSLSWTVPDGAPEGEYDAVTAVWKREGGGKLYDRLDERRRRDAIEVDQIDISARIRSFDAPSGTFAPGDIVRAETTVENTGDATHTFYVGYGFIGPDGNEYDNDGSTHEAVTIGPGARRTVQLSWKVPDDAPEGRYDAATAVWKREEGGKLEGRLDDQRRYDAVRVSEPEVKAAIRSLTIETDSISIGDAVQSTAVVENTGEVESTFVVRFHARGPDGVVVDGSDDTSKVVTLAPGMRESVQFEWTAPKESPAGSYDAIVAVWSASDRPIDGSAPIDEYTESNAIEVEPQNGDLLVTVIGPDGRPVGGATVTLGDGRTKRTDADGEVRFTELEEGSYEFTIEHEGYETETVSAFVATDETQRREVRLTPPDVVITDVEGVPESYQPGEWFEPTISVRNTGSIEATFIVRLPERSGFEVDGDPTRAVTLASGGETSITFKARFYGTETDRTFLAKLELKDGLVLDERKRPVEYADTILLVTVVDNDGNPVEGVDVTVLQEGAPVKSTDEDGAARFSSIIPGTTVIEVSASNIEGGASTEIVDVKRGERTEETVRISQTGTLTGTVVDEGGDPLDGVTVKVDGQTTTVGPHGAFRFDVPFAVDTYTLKVVEDGQPLLKRKVSVSAGSNDVPITVERTDGSASGGWQLVDNANKGALLGEVGIQLGVPGSKTLEYHAGWLGMSLVPVLDAPADIRDCLLAPNDDLATNGLDCGGATASTVGSAGTVIGVITSPSGAGVVVAGGSFSLDTAEDLTDVVRVSTSLVKNVPSKIDEWAEILISKVGDTAYRAVDQIKQADVAAKLGKSLSVRHLQMKAGLDKKQAETVVKSSNSARKAAKSAIRLVEDGSEPETIVQIAKSGGDVGKTRKAVRVGDEVVWLEEGTNQKAWKHIENRIGDFKSSSKLNVQNEDELQSLVVESVEKAHKEGNVYSIPKRDGGGSAYVSKMGEGQPVTVIVAENGYIVTSYPGLPKNIDVTL